MSWIRSGEGAWSRDEWEYALGLEPADPPGHAHVDALPPEPESVRAARRFVRGVLDEWGAADDTADTAVLLTSEMATNAVLHARTPFSVLVTRHDDRVAVAVADGSSLPPTVQHFGRTQTTGRGLRLLETLAAEWHVSARPSGGLGKAVWFELPMAGLGRDDDALALAFLQGGSSGVDGLGVDA